VHLEPVTEGLRVRFRVDGVMHDVFTAPRGTEAGVISRLKVLAGMDIAERRLPQDGRASHAVDGQTVDLRVATVPTIHGEAAVIRILDNRAEIARLDDLGFLPANLALLREAIRRPWGAVLVTGPTGSGKTTTLYGALSELNDPVRNVITVEDPVEITMDGIKQVQVNTRAGLTFASALRSFLRADPDVVLIGEIRDVETATIAAEASLTGHLVLSSIHTNDAASTPMRLLEMGVEPFLVASAVQAVVAQRLARKLCERCRIAHEPTDAELDDLGWDRTRLLDGERPTLYRHNGCQACGDTGYRGRVALHEIMMVSDTLAAALGRRCSVDEIRTIAAAEGMRTLHEDGLVKVSMGLTSLEELARVLA
jgi:type IV pilus assembly protein PilB